MSNPFNFLPVSRDLRVTGTQFDASRALDKAGRAVDSTVDLNRRVEILALANQALFELLQDRLGLRAEDVLARMAEIDLRDGTKDGKIGARILACPGCGRTVSSTRRQCMYCDTPITEGHVFEKS